MEMEYTRAFLFPREDPDGLKKWALTGALGLIPVVGQILLLGYGVEVARRVIREEAHPLPEWTDFTTYARKGLGVVVINLVYWLPLALAVLCLSALLAGLSLLGQRSGAAGGDALAGLMGTCLGFFALVYVVIAGMLTQAAVGQYAATDQLSAALQVGAHLARVRAKPGLYLVVALISALAQIVLTLVGVVACCVGAVWGLAYAQMAHAHLVGQAHRYGPAADVA